MELASCTRAFVTSTPCRRPIASISSQVSANPSSSPNNFNPLFCCAVERNPSSSTRSTCSSIAGSSPSLHISANPKSFSKRHISVFYAVEGNSTSSSTTADAELPSSDKEQGADVAEISAEVEEQESLGKALSQMRQERVVSGEDNPSKTEEFWRGVLEETRLIEWPSLQKVLGTTGVVTSIIVGASLVLLTVNALLAQLSDAFFKNAPPA